jgi:apurinic endonuclease APN1
MEHKTYRVRHLISSLDSIGRASLHKLLPKKLLMPVVETGKYPAAILSMLPKGESYSILGCVAEELLRLPVDKIVVETLHEAIHKFYPTYSDEQKSKIVKSKTTEPFLGRIRATRTKLDEVVKGKGTLEFDTVVSYEAVEGHPDAQTPTQLFEVKLTGLLKKNWQYFLFQIFAYAALHKEATDVYLVLPLQDTVWHHDVTKWSNRTAYRDLLNNMSKGQQGEVSPLPGFFLQHSHCIGCHVVKKKTVYATLRELKYATEKPYQMFLTGSQNSKIEMKDEDVASAAEEQQNSAVRMWVHSPYVINLCHEPGTLDDYGVECLKKHLYLSAAMGLKGVVVHVGKSVKMDLPTALDNMRKNLENAMEAATPECPILLETPAGQGTETLTSYDDFLAFVTSFHSPKLRVCIDTCHVFASGQNPFDYIKKMMETDPTLLRLVHFNDSATPCGSCVDRHAFIGTGKIGFAAMKEIADYCKSKRVPMLAE